MQSKNLINSQVYGIVIWAWGFVNENRASFQQWIAFAWNWIPQFPCTFDKCFTGMSEICFWHNIDLDFVELTCSARHFADPIGSNIHVHLKSAWWSLPYALWKSIPPPCAIFAPLWKMVLPSHDMKPKLSPKFMRMQKKQNRHKVKNNWIMPQMVSRICTSVSSPISHHSYHPEINLFQRSLYLVLRFYDWLSMYRHVHFLPMTSQ